MIIINGEYKVTIRNTSKRTRAVFTSRSIFNLIWKILIKDYDTFEIVGENNPL